jgi:endonuclease/exonuclease/phosphatase family metal-dependent hydrolase
LLKGARADVIGLNEVLHPYPTTTGAALLWLADQLGMYVAFAAREPRRRSGNSLTGGSGNAILSRFPFASVACGLYTHLPGKTQRGFLETRLALGAGQAFIVVCTHLDHTDERARQSQFDDLIAWYEQTSGLPDLILGDFNCVHPRAYDGRPEAFAALSTHPVAAHLANAPDGPRLAREIEQAGYVDALVERGVLQQGTFIPAPEPVRFDYIWLRSDWASRLTHAAIVQEPAGQEASDHRPIIAELEFVDL